MLITCVMRHARTHKLQLSGPTVYFLYCVPLPWLVAGTISAVSRTAFTFVDEKFESPIALHSPFFTRSSIACKDFRNLLSTNKRGGSIFTSLVWFFSLFLGADYMSRVVPACRVDSAKRVDYEIAITCTRPSGLSLLITI